jgi:hypothetical protein
MRWKSGGTHGSLSTARGTTGPPERPASSPAWPTSPRMPSRSPNVSTACSLAASSCGGSRHPRSTASSGGARSSRSSAASTASPVAWRARAARGRGGVALRRGGHAHRAVRARSSSSRRVRSVGCLRGPPSPRPPGRERHLRHEARPAPSRPVELVGDVRFASKVDALFDACLHRDTYTDRQLRRAYDQLRFVHGLRTSAVQRRIAARVPTTRRSPRSSRSSTGIR